MITAALEAPPTVTVKAPGWQAPGEVIGRAPYSLLVAWTDPGGDMHRAWFAFQPGYVGHGRMHGVSTEDALRIEPA